jgi:hypothetical protein
MNKLTTHLCKTAYARIKALCLYVPVNRMVSIANLIRLNIYFFLLMIKLNTDLLVRSRH